MFAKSSTFTCSLAQNINRKRGTLSILCLEQVRRDVIIELHRLGNDPPKIREITKYPKGTVNNVIKRYKEKGTTKRKAHKKRKDTVIDEDLKQFVKTVWQPSMSIRDLARQTNVAATTILRAIRGEAPHTQTTAPGVILVLLNLTCTL